MVFFSVQELLQFISGRVANSTELGTQAEAIKVSRPASLAGSQATDVAFFFSRAFEHELAQAQPGVLITAEPFVEPLKNRLPHLWRKTAIISCKDPYLSMAILSEKFASNLSSVAHIPSQDVPKTKIHPTAVVDPSAELGTGVEVGAHCVIESGVKIGQGTVLYPGSFIGTRSVLGEFCVLFPGVTLYEWTQLGNRVRIHAGSVLGSDGFGYSPRIENGRPLGHQKIYHLGRVIVGDDVEIGANSCVDRATFGETRIEKNVKLDNLVHIGHNAKLDEGTVICGGTCLAGNSSTGKYVVIGGLTGIGNHVHIGDGASVGALSMVTKDVAPKGTAVGNPQREHQEHFRAHALLSRLLKERRNK